MLNLTMVRFYFKKKLLKVIIMQNENQFNIIVGLKYFPVIKSGFFVGFDP